MGLKVVQVDFKFPLIFLLKQIYYFESIREFNTNLKSIWTGFNQAETEAGVKIGIQECHIKVSAHSSKVVSIITFWAIKIVP